MRREMPRFDETTNRSDDETLSTSGDIDDDDAATAVLCDGGADEAEAVPGTGVRAAGTVGTLPLSGDA